MTVESFLKGHVRVFDWLGPRRRHLAPLASGSLREKPPATLNRRSCQAAPWCTFRFLKPAHFSVPVDNERGRQPNWCGWVEEEVGCERGRVSSRSRRRMRRPAALERFARWEMCCSRGLSDAALSALECRARKHKASGDQAGGHQD